MCHHLIVIIFGTLHSCSTHPLYDSVRCRLNNYASAFPNVKYVSSHPAPRAYCVLLSNAFCLIRCKIMATDSSTTRRYSPVSSKNLRILRISSRYTSMSSSSTSTTMTSMCTRQKSTVRSMAVSAPCTSRDKQIDVVDANGGQEIGKRDALYEIEPCTVMGMAVIPRTSWRCLR